MPTNYTKSEINSTTDYSNQQNFSPCGYFHMIPGHIFNDNSIPKAIKLFYGLLTSLCSMHGFSWATNNYLSQRFGVSPRQIQKYLKFLQQKKVVFLDFFDKYDRKIWISETFHVRDRLKEICTNEYEYNEELNKRFYRYEHSNGYIANKGTARSRKEKYINKKEVVKKSDNIKIEHYVPPPSEPTTSFKKKKKKLQIPFEDYKKDKLIKEWGEKIAVPIIKRIETLMVNNTNAYTKTDPYEDATRFCAEESSRKNRRFNKRQTQENKESIVEKNLDAINYINQIFKPSEDIFHFCADTKTVSVVFHGKTNRVALDYTQENFRDQFYEWYEGYEKKSK